MSSATFPIRLQSAREFAGMSLQGLADASGTSHSSGAGELSHRIAAALGHSSPTITERHYAAPAVVADAKQARRLERLKGGSDGTK